MAAVSQNLNGVVVERYRPEQEYDLILANYAIDTKTPTYRISELGTAYDRETIKNDPRTLSIVDFVNFLEI